MPFEIRDRCEDDDVPAADGSAMLPVGFMTIPRCDLLGPPPAAGRCEYIVVFVVGCGDDAGRLVWRVVSKIGFVAVLSEVALPEDDLLPADGCFSFCAPLA